MRNTRAVPLQKQAKTLLNMERLSFLWLENKKICLKESSYARYYALINRHILPYFKNVKPHEISNESINNFVKIKTNSGLSPKTVLDILSLLIQIVKFGQKQGFINSFELDISKPKRQQKELPIFSKFDQKRFLNYIKSNLNCEKLGIILAFYTGIRLGELCALTWGDIDFESGGNNGII